MQVDNALIVESQEYLREHKIMELFEVHSSSYNMCRTCARA